MSKKRDYSVIEKQLEIRKKELGEELAELSVREGTFEDVKDTADEALSAVLESVKTSLQNTELQEYKKIVKALELIKQGKYGICTDCSEEISLKRLEAYPNVLRCLLCQEKLEERDANNSFSSFS
ncbi:TraR/DksA family transcriptional regulator [Candidatus Babeliales bacterium]|nr:TraR/DksA family transcriptional regulator [Candidatus Babeliales bacterium]